MNPSIVESRMSAMPIARVYADTSVFGGVFDAAFRDATRLFFDQVRTGRFQLVTSAVVQAGIGPAPAGVRSLFEEMLAQMEIVEITERVLRLRDSYLEAGIVSQRWSDDALHVATASISGCLLIVSWNFRHIVHSRRSRFTMLSTLLTASPTSVSFPLWRLLNMKTRTIDCVDMMHRGAGRVQEALAAVAAEQELSYWEQRSEELKRAQKQAQDRQRDRPRRT